MDNRIKDLISSDNTKPPSEILKEENCRKSLDEELHHDFIIAPIDKATGNVAFFVKYYMQMIC